MASPSKYRTKYNELVYRLALLGATDKEMAEVIGIAESTFYLWKEEHPSFVEYLNRGKTNADAKVAERLYERAMGFEHDDVYPSSYQGVVTLTPIKKHYPPDTQAASLWLRNRQSARWRDRQEITGKDGDPLIVQIVKHADNLPETEGEPITISQETRQLLAELKPETTAVPQPKPEPEPPAPKGQGQGQRATNSAGPVPDALINGTARAGRQKGTGLARRERRRRGILGSGPSIV